MTTKERMQELIKDKRIWFGAHGDDAPRSKKFLSEVKEGVVPLTIGTRDEVGDNQEAKKEIKALFPDDPFSTPKPERLIQRILALAAATGDYVLDSFLGSGTTAAVAHKMGRRYTGVETGEQAKTHCAARLKRVIDGEQGGVSRAAGWTGGSGFRFFTLGDAVFDDERRIQRDISFDQLAAHIYFTETKTPLNRRICRGHDAHSPFLGAHEGAAYALLYNGVAGDTRIDRGNVLTHATLNAILRAIDAAAQESGAAIAYRRLVVYGEATRLSRMSLANNNIIFKQTPYDIKAWR
jgi:adenine-specific DNA-methyltransferase